LTRFKTTLWIYALDDRIDNNQLTEEQLAQVLAGCYTIGCGSDQFDQTDELQKSLWSLRGELAEHDNFKQIEAYWSTSLVRVIDGMMYEHWMQKRFKPVHVEDALPPFAEYLYYAHYSIALIHLWVTGLILEPDESIPAAMVKLLGLAEQCGIVMRLANDYSTFGREMVEGGVSAVLLRAHELWLESPALDSSELLTSARSDVRASVAMEWDKATSLVDSQWTRTRVEDRFLR
jgi:hypothetical protein